jgi:hypothetical protein
MRSILILLFCCLNLFALAQKPMPIYSFATERQTPEWYYEQIKLWKAVLDKNNKNAFAWYSYYRATRNWIRTNPNEKRSHEEKSKQLDDILSSMATSIPETFEYNMVNWMHHGNDMAYRSCLDKAYALGRDREEIVCDMINIYEIERKVELRNKFAKRWL